jgi:hypothetical protein
MSHAALHPALVAVRTQFARAVRLPGKAAHCRGHLGQLPAAGEADGAERDRDVGAGSASGAQATLRRNQKRSIVPPKDPAAEDAHQGVADGAR